jgi:hypothetical protein
MFAGATIAQLEGHAWATSLVISAGVVLLLISAVISALMARVRDRAIDLITGGRETLPIAVVQRERRRLLTRRRTQILAKTLDTMIRYTTTPPKIRTTATRPLYDPTVITRVAPDLRAVIENLQSEHTHARGVALTEQLITDGRSPLYGENEGRLREELHRVRSALDE